MKLLDLGAKIGVHDAAGELSLMIHQHSFFQGLNLCPALSAGVVGGGGCDVSFFMNL